MQGRTRSFFEDVFVLLIIIVILGVGYYFFFSSDTKEIQTPVIEQTTELTEEKIDLKEEQSLTPEVQEVEIEESIQTQILEQDSQKIDEALKEERQKESKQSQNNQDTKEDIKTPKIPNNQIQEEVLGKKDEPKAQKVDPKRIAHLVKNVDLKALQQFKHDVEKAMKDTIVLNNKKDKKVQSFSIRVTVLKSGEYEQLIYTGGDKETYENNQENLLQVFPLNIEDNIKQDFPRYLRYTFQFNNNDN